MKLIHPVPTLFPYTTLFRSSRETIAASIQKVTEDLMLAVVRHWLDRHKVRHLGLGGGLFANVRLNSLRSEEHTSELQSQSNLVCRLLLEKKKNSSYTTQIFL